MPTEGRVVRSPLRLADYVEPGDNIVWGQACGEPQTLTELLIAQRHELGGVRCFIGIPMTDTVRADRADGLSIASYCGTGSNSSLYRAGILDIRPIHYSTIPALLSAGIDRADVVFVQVSAPDELGRHSMGLTDDYLAAAVDAARVVLVEVNDKVPFTVGSKTLHRSDWTAAVYSSREPAQMPPSSVTGVTEEVARNVASLIEDGATLQFGIGAVPEAVLRQLDGRTDLGIHSGVLNDAAMHLIRSGIANGRRKSVDTGVAVAGFVTGTRELFDFVDMNPVVNIRSTTYTHDAAVLRAQKALVAINSAIEVDLFGAVNSEVAGGRYVGAVGGAMDFLRGAASSPGGLPIVALPSSAKGRTRIVPSLSGPASTPRTDAGIVVTENGIADLRGVGLDKRVEKLLEIASPEHRGDLEAGAESLLSGSRRSEREVLT